MATSWIDKRNKALMELMSGNRNVAQLGQGVITSNEVLNAHRLMDKYMKKSQRKRFRPREDTWIDHQSFTPDERHRRRSIERDIRQANERAQRWGGQDWKSLQTELATNKAREAARQRSVLSERLTRNYGTRSGEAKEKLLKELEEEYTKGIKGFEERQDVLRGTGGLKVTPTTIGGLAPYSAPLKHGVTRDVWLNPTETVDYKAVAPILAAEREAKYQKSLSADPYATRPQLSVADQRALADEEARRMQPQLEKYKAHVTPENLPVLYGRRQDPILAGLIQSDIDQPWGECGSGSLRGAVYEMSGLSNALRLVGTPGTTGLPRQNLSSTGHVQTGNLAGAPSGGYHFGGVEAPTGLQFRQGFSPGLVTGASWTGDLSSGYPSPSRFRRGEFESWDPATRWRYLRTAFNPQSLDIHGQPYGYTRAPVDYWSPGMELQQEAAGMQNPVWNPQLNQYVEDPSQYGPVQSGQPMGFMDYWAAKQAGTLPQFPTGGGLSNLLLGTGRGSPPIGAMGQVPTGAMGQVPTGGPTMADYGPTNLGHFYGYTPSGQGLSQQITSLKGTGHPIYG